MLPSVSFCSLARFPLVDRSSSIGPIKGRQDFESNCPDTDIQRVENILNLYLPRPIY
jgi:hypothetical protein